MERAPGASFVHVTLPGLAGVIATALLLRTIWVANSLDLILVMTNGGPGTATQTLPLHAFLTAWSGGDYGQGSALAVILARSQQALDEVLASPVPSADEIERDVYATMTGVPQ